MSYSIYKSDGTAVVVPDNAVDQGFNNSGANGGRGIGLQLVGLGSPDYVVPTGQNFLQLVENFCSQIMPPDDKALQGQLWFNKTSGTTGELYVRVSSSGIGDMSNWKQILIGNTPVTPGSYTSADITVDAQGRIVSASNGAASSNSFAPYFIESSEVFTVPTNRQVLWSLPIDNEGVLDIDGILVAVN